MILLRNSILLLALALVPLNAALAEEPPSVAKDSADAVAGVPATDALKNRVLGRWQALIERDHAAAYAFESPGYRATVPEASYRGAFGPAAVWKDAEVVRIDLAEDGRSAKVMVMIEYEPRLPMSGDFATTRRPVKEAWILKDSQWWHVSGK